MAKSLFHRYLSADDGGMTAFGLFMFGASLLMGSYAIDVSHLEAQRTLLQTAADAAAHDALVTREIETEDVAIAAAVLRANAIMPANHYGKVLKPENVVFGTWDKRTRVFTQVSGARSAVRVTLRRTGENGNPIATYLMKLVGIRNWDVVLISTFATYQPQCLREGFVAEGVVDLQSNNGYFSGFCIHSNSYVKLSSNNVFESGTVVSMPDLSRLDLPQSGYQTNIGLTEALRADSINIRVLKRIQRIINEVSDPSSPYYPNFLTSAAPIALSNSTISATDLISGHIYRWSCNSGNGGTIANGTLVSGVVIIADCDVKLGNGAAMEDAILLTTSTSATSINSPNGFRLGKNDHCVKGGGGRIVSMGGMKFAAALEIYGSQLLAMGNVEFAAQANGIEGASIISNRAISGTSNMSMSYCNGGLDEFTAEYFQLVQ